MYGIKYITEDSVKKEETSVEYNVNETDILMSESPSVTAQETVVLPSSAQIDDKKSIQSKIVW